MKIRNATLLLISLVALTSIGCATTRVVEPGWTETSTTTAPDGTITETTKVVEAVIEPVTDSENGCKLWQVGCSSTHLTLNRGGKVVGATSKNGFNAINLVLPTGAPSPGSEDIKLAIGASTASHGNIRNAIAGVVENGADGERSNGGGITAEAILAARADPRNIAGAVGNGASAQSSAIARQERREEIRRERVERINPRYRHLYR